jgi:uncharacterized protein YhaN
LALAEHLTQQDEVCPIMLDDVTTQCDAPRTEAILEILYEASRIRQVIVFNQEPAVLRWARQRLDSSRDRIVELPTT